MKPRALNRRILFRMKFMLQHEIIVKKKRYVTSDGITVFYTSGKHCCIMYDNKLVHTFMIQYSKDEFGKIIRVYLTVFPRSIDHSLARVSEVNLTTIKQLEKLEVFTKAFLPY